MGHSDSFSYFVISVNYIIIYFEKLKDEKFHLILTLIKKNYYFLYINFYYLIINVLIK
jgi:hypothetical protein